MRFSSFLSKQARRPSGIFGRFYMGPLFEKGNMPLNAFVKQNLSIHGSEHMLEIGCGPGFLLNSIAEELDDGIVEGIDFSRAMISMATKRNRKHIRNGKVIIRSGDFNKLGLEKSAYDGVVSVNTIYFWEEPHSTISKIYELLKPGGKLVLGFHNRDDMEKMKLDKKVFQFYSEQEVEDLLKTGANFGKVKIASQKEPNTIAICAIATK
jgi:SAM-dependent methyltransferase